ncbi:diguanylate cyclase [bacterium]|nr:MAG: diguanylate cyclase [bacterium]
MGGVPSRIEVADRVIKFISHFIRERFRDFDTLARFSPSGFSFILPDLDSDIGAGVVARVTGELSEHMAEDSEAASLRIRTGLASYPENASTTERLLEVAEAALLKAVEDRSAEVVIWEE